MSYATSREVKGCLGQIHWTAFGQKPLLPHSLCLLTVRGNFCERQPRNHTEYLMQTAIVESMSSCSNVLERHEVPTIQQACQLPSEQSQ